MARTRFVPYRDVIALPEADMLRTTAEFRAVMTRRRSVRQFSTQAVDRAAIEDCIAAAHAAPSGANMQPWHFAVVSNPALKAEIRRGAEKEERDFDDGARGAAAARTFSPFGVGRLKPFLEQAPYLIVVFQKNYAIAADHPRQAHYYIPESVGIAVGVLISGLHHAGLATLIHTPRPMGFLRRILKRPPNERASMIVVVGRPADGATVPVLKKKPLGEVVTFFD